MFEKLKTTNNGQCSNFYGAKMSQGVKIYMYINSSVKDCQSAVKGEVEVRDEVSLTATDDHQVTQYNM